MGSPDRLEGRPRYSRSLRKAFDALETASLKVADSSKPTEAEIARAEKARLRLEQRGIPQSIIEVHMITGKEAPTQYGVYKVFAPSGSDERAGFDQRTRQLHDTVLWDAILSGKPVFINNLQEQAREGYKPITPTVRPIPPEQ